MNYDYSYVTNGVDGSLLGVAFAMWFGAILISLAFSVISYVFQSLGFYNIAKRRAIHHPWLAWIPVGSGWILGSISDQYHYVTEGKVTNRRKVLLGLSIATLVLSIGVCGTYISQIVKLTMGYEYKESDAMVLIGVVGAALIMAAASVVSCVFQYMCYYDLFKSCKPDSAMIFLLLSIFLGVTRPFFVFACSKKDEGMPRRRQPVIMPQGNFQPVSQMQHPEAQQAQEVPVQEAPAQEVPEQEAPAQDTLDEETKCENTDDQ